MHCGMLTSTAYGLHVLSPKRRTARLFKPPHNGRTGMHCGMLTSTAYGLRVLFQTAYRAPLQAAPLGAHQHALRHAHQHGVRITRAPLDGAPRASSSRPTWDARRSGPRFNASNKSNYSNAYNMPEAGKSAKDANPGAAPPGKDWKPLRSGE